MSTAPLPRIRRLIVVAHAHAHVHSHGHGLARPARRPGGDGERGEGVISAAIVVLIMAFLGAAMWLAFRAIFTDAAARTSTQVNTIGGG